MDSIARLLPLGLSALVVAGFPASVLFQVIGQSRPLAWPEMSACVAFGVLVVWLARYVGVPKWATRVGALQLDIRNPPLWAVIAVGTVVRVFSWVLVEPRPSSDGATYLELASRLLAGAGYGSESFKAYWPPGFALVLYPLIAVLPSGLALLVFGLASYLVTSFGMLWLGRAIGLGGLAMWPVALLAIWPGHVLMTGLPEKELLVIGLLPWILWGCIQLQRRLAWGGLAGVLLGVVVLIQPSFQLIPFFAAVLLAAYGVPFRRIALGLLVVLAGAAAVIAPWTARNHAIFDKVVLVSTNGGSNFYRANNELATGGYLAVGKVDVEALPELEADRVGKQLAVKWIGENPADFARLVAARVLLFPGDHSYGAFAAFRDDPSRIPRVAYLALKATAALPWLLAWALVVGAAWQLCIHRRPPVKATLFLLVPWLYLSGIHAFFESGSKYHLSAMACMMVWVTAMLSEAANTTRRPQ